MLSAALGTGPDPLQLLSSLSRCQHQLGLQTLPRSSAGRVSQVAPSKGLQAVVEMALPQHNESVWDGQVARRSTRATRQQL